MAIDNVSARESGFEIKIPRFETIALDLLHDVAETVVVNLFEDSNLVALCAKRSTLLPTHILLRNEY